MSSITDLIKELREKTGAGFLDCKKSLEDNDNDIEKSIEALRKKGLAKASKKSDRAANEGAVGVFKNNNIIAVIISMNPTSVKLPAKSELIWSSKRKPINPAVIIEIIIIRAKKVFSSFLNVKTLFKIEITSSLK